ncbi:hypothetical protein [Brevundimonas sp.]|uniref:hypothetical protein n=1 Tax=Brevundimonas sp. TaxID=1871086 RepID=UPI002FCA2896
MEAVLPLATRSPSQLDPDVPENRAQARWEFDRARDFGNDADLAAWAKRWGPGFVAGSEDLEGQIEALEEEVKNLEAATVDTSGVDAELDEVSACITTALENLDVDTAPDAVAQLKDAQTYVGKARTELEKL